MLLWVISTTSIKQNGLKLRCGRGVVNGESVDICLHNPCGIWVSPTLYKPLLLVKEGHLGIIIRIKSFFFSLSPHSYAFLVSIPFAQLSRSRGTAVHDASTNSLVFSPLFPFLFSHSLLSRTTIQSRSHNPSYITSQDWQPSRH